MQKSRMQEEATAKALGGKRRQGSGSCPWLPQDVRSDKFLVQDKSTSKPSIRIYRKDLEKLEEDALCAGKIPAFVFGYSEGDRIKDNWIAFPIEGLIMEVLEDPLLFTCQWIGRANKSVSIRKSYLAGIINKPALGVIFCFELNGGVYEWVAMPLAYFQDNYFQKMLS